MQTTPDEYDELLDCRMAMLGLNLDATNGDTFNEDHATLQELWLSGSLCGGLEARSQQPGVGNLLSKHGRVYCACRGST
jgi:hypothetical protein